LAFDPDHASGGAKRASIGGIIRGSDRGKQNTADVVLNLPFPSVPTVRIASKRSLTRKRTLTAQRLSSKTVQEQRREKRLQLSNFSGFR
jgi:hypothetical protein